MGWGFREGRWRRGWNVGYLFGASGRRPRALGVSSGRLPFHVVRVVWGILAALLLYNFVGQSGYVPHTVSSSE